MKSRKLFRGSVITIAGLLFAYVVLSQYAKVKGVSFVDLVSKVFPEKVEEIINGGNKIIYLSTSLPETLKTGITDWANDKYLLVYFSEEPESNANYVLSSQDFGEYDLAWKKYYVPVVSVKSHLDGISTEEFTNLLAGNAVVVSDNAYELVISNSSGSYLNNNYTLGVSVPSSSEITEQIYADAGLIGFLPFEEVNSKVKIISIGEDNLLTNFNDDTYPFIEYVWVKDTTSVGLFEEVQGVLGTVNFDPESLTTAVITGTSVMGARGLFQKSEEVGDPIYPIREVANILKNADIAHVSNEAAFVSGCEQGSWSLVFCGTLESFDAFTFAGIDVVGLTGNHVLDYGDKKFIETLDLYEENGIQYFGGGKNFTDAHTPAVETVNGMTFAFLGYNNIPPVSSFATSSDPGSAELDLNQMTADISDAASKYDFVLVDMQWGNEYENTPLIYQEEYGRAAIDAGADVVTGVHPHWVQKMEYYKGGVIFYGIGNLLFDQMWSQRTREGIMVKHYFHNGSYIGFKLIPTIIYEGAQPRLVSGAEAEKIIDYLF
ncbi:MAG: CapA family protein [bacterium]